MKSEQEMAQSVLARRDAYLQKKKKRQQSMIRYGIPALCFILVVGCCTAVLRSGMGNPPALSDHAISSSEDSFLSSRDAVSGGTLAPSLPSAEPSGGLQKTSAPPSPSHATDSSRAQTASAASAPYESAQEIIHGNASQPAMSSSQSATGSECEPFAYQVYFSSIASFKSYLSSLGLPVVDTPAESSSAVSSSRPIASLPDEPVDSSAAGSQNSPPTDPSEDGPWYADEIPPEPSEIWMQAWSMFETGTFIMPALGEGNELLSLKDIYVDQTYMNYYYRFNNIRDQSRLSYDLVVDVYAEKTALQPIYEKKMSENNYKQCTGGGITYTLFQSDGGNVNCWIFWQQDGRFFRATYYGNSKYITSILPTLSMTAVSWQS